MVTRTIEMIKSQIKYVRAYNLNAYEQLSVSRNRYKTLTYRFASKTMHYWFVDQDKKWHKTPPWEYIALAMLYQTDLPDNSTFWLKEQVK